MANRMDTIWKGMGMGIAEVIPGVSGGTIAFITGIYERLLLAIKSIGPSLWREYKQSGVAGVWSAVDGSFLLRLFGGMVVGLLIGIFGVTYFLENYPEPLWAFFFGLILASAWVIAKTIPQWDIRKIVALFIGAGVAFWITMVSPTEGSTAYPYVFISGMLAISALMLPGISGSFILLLMGMYSIIVPKIKHLLTAFNIEDFMTLVVFGLGCLTGVGAFSRVLSWLFEHHRDLTLATMTGFLLGALNKVWPWRNPIQIFDKELAQILPVENISLLQERAHDTYKIVKESNVLPGDYHVSDPMTMLCIVAGVIGLLAVLGIDRMNSARAHNNV